MPIKWSQSQGLSLFIQMLVPGKKEDTLAMNSIASSSTFARSPSWEVLDGREAAESDNTNHPIYSKKCFPSNKQHSLEIGLFKI